MARRYSPVVVSGIAIGVLGISMALSTYSIYKSMLNSCKKKYAPEIMKLNDKIMKS